MSHAYVRYKPGADSLTISLVLAGRQRNLNRPIDEPLEKPLTRIRANLAPSKQDKRKKKAKPSPADAADGGGGQQPELFVGLFSDAAGTRPIDAATPNGDAWPRAALLRVGSQAFEVRLNPPTVETLSLQAFPMPGYPLLPTHSLAFADPSLSSWRWLRRRQQQQQGAAGAHEWEETGCRDMLYTPTPEDVGCMLRVECMPAAASAQHAAAQPAAGSEGSRPPAATELGEPATADTGPVRAAPQQPAARLRQLSPAVALQEAWRLRVMSYNILADQYAGTAYAQQVLFKYCPTQLLDNNYRRQLVLQEIKAYQPDVCCLQEVDDKVFSEYLQPHLGLEGFSGHYTNKQGRVREGSATFWRSSKWGAAAVQDVLLRDVFRQPLSQRHAQFVPMLEASHELDRALQKVATIAQMVLLVPREAASAALAAPPPGADAGAAATGLAAGAPAPVLVINTHLFFHPYAPHIRTLHTAAVLEEAAAALAAWQQQAAAAAADGGGGGNGSGSGAGAAAADATPASAVVEPGLLAALAVLPPPTLLFCGDLNSDLNDGVPGVIELLQTGALSASHWDWKMGAEFRWGKEEEEYAAEAQQQEQEQGQQQQQQQQQEQGQQEQQQQPADGHDFDPPAASPKHAVPVVVGTDVRIPFVLRSADDLATPYTNYTSGYKALLDYVWYDPRRLCVTAQLPQPAEALLAGFIPSPSFPSDHLAVVYDLAFKPQPAGTPAEPGAPAAAAAGAPPGAGGGGGGGGPLAHAAGAFALLPASDDHVADAVAALAHGGVVALPTDTLYGLAAAADDAAAVQQLRRIKARSPAHPFALAVAEVADVSLHCEAERLPAGLLAALLPGPVTVLLPLRAGAPPLAPGVLNPAPDGGDGDGGAAAAGTAVVGVRVVPTEFVRRVVSGCRGRAVALTSANLSGSESSLCVHDFRELWQYCAAVFDGGRVPAASRLGSTIVDLTALAAGRERSFRIVRAGVAAESVAELLTASFGLAQAS